VRFASGIRAFLIAALLLGAALARAADPAPPVMKLGDAVRPLGYALDLRLLPDSPGFDGKVEIDIELQRPLDFFWINGRQLEIKRASLLVGGRTLPVAATAAGEEFIGVRLPETVPAGRARLVLEYSGRVSAVETRGLFRQQTGGDWYLFSQFESTAARRAFPGFDEPRWKTPFTVSLTVRREHLAVSNTPMLGEDAAAGGMKRVRFATTAPLPTYLVALGVGPFDVVDGGTAGISRTPLRYIVPRGRGADTRYARATTPRLLALLEDYFGRPYPYPKLDSMVIPITVAFGAMENPGLITYRSGLLLAPPDREDERFQQRYASVAAHEIAHQWFGDLVTMAWWDDLWLNESFATWMARKTVQQLNPQWEASGRRNDERQAAFRTDRLSSTRQIRQAVETRDDLGNAFDRITYDKGGAVLTMYESWLGEAAFRDGVRRYLKQHEWGNATAQDFFAALAVADPQVAEGFASFVGQPGLPLVDFELDCSKPRPAVLLRQQRFLPASADASAGAAQRWDVPACLRYEGQAGDKPLCTVLREREQRLELPAGAACPAWLLPNPGGVGYYLSRLGARELQGLAAAPLQAADAVFLLGDQHQLAASGALPLARLLALAGPLAADPRPEVAAAAAHAVSDIHPALLDAAQRTALAGWVHRHFGARATQLSWLPAAGDSDAVRKLRAVVVPLVAQVGADPELRAQARTLALAWLAGDRGRMGAGYKAILETAAQDGDAPLFDAFVAALGQARDSSTRIDIDIALGHFRAPALLQRAFELALADGQDLREAREIYDAAGGDPLNAPALLRFAGLRLDDMARAMPEDTLARMPRWHTKLCTPQDRAAVQALYAQRLARVAGGPRNLAQALEQIDICIANRDMQAAAGLFAR
jgi:alanyl aminopeptidase